MMNQAVIDTFILEYKIIHKQDNKKDVYVVDKNTKKELGIKGNKSNFTRKELWDNVIPEKYKKNKNISESTGSGGKKSSSSFSSSSRSDNNDEEYDDNNEQKSIAGNSMSSSSSLLKHVKKFIKENKIVEEKYIDNIKKPSESVKNAFAKGEKIWKVDYKALKEKYGNEFKGKSARRVYYDREQLEELVNSNIKMI